MKENVWRLGPFRSPSRTEEIVFGQVREDYGFEASLVKGSVLCIASGGDLAFEALARGADRVVAIDVNVAQLHLVELKAQALRQAAYTDVLKCFTDSVRPFYPRLKAGLSPECAAFFDARPALLDSDLQNCGAADRVIRRLARLYKMLVGPKQVAAFLMLSDLDQQKEFFQRIWNNWFWRFSFRAAFNPFTLRWILGRMFADAIPKTFARDFNAAFDEVFLTVPNLGNPFVWQAMEGRFPPRYFPSWLRDENWLSLQGHLDRLSLRAIDVLDCLNQAQPGEFDLICLTNVLDVVPPGYREELIRALERVCVPGNQVLSRSFFKPAKITEALEAKGFAEADRPAYVDRSFFCRNLEHLIRL